MTDRPLLFQAAMVLATLRPVDPKTETRRTRGLDEGSRGVLKASAELFE